MNKEYENLTMDGFFYKKPGFYFLYKPVRVDYEGIISDARAKGFKVSSPAILEKSVAFGRGFIAVQIDPSDVPKQHASDVISLKGDFLSYTHTGSYDGLKSAYKKVMDDHASAREFYNLYLNDSKSDDPSSQKTMILFR